MTVLGLPTSMFLVFVATVLAGSLGAIHYTVVHILLRKPFGDESSAERAGGAAGNGGDTSSPSSRSETHV